MDSQQSAKFTVQIFLKMNDKIGLSGGSQAQSKFFVGSALIKGL